MREAGRRRGWLRIILGNSTINVCGVFSSRVCDGIPPRMKTSPRSEKPRSRGIPRHSQSHTFHPPKEKPPAKLSGGWGFEDCYSNTIRSRTEQSHSGFPASLKKIVRQPIPSIFFVLHRKSGWFLHVNAMCWPYGSILQLVQHLIRIHAIVLVLRTFGLDFINNLSHSRIFA